MFGLTSQQIMDNAGPGGESQAFDYATPLESFTSAYNSADLADSSLGIAQNLAGQVDVRDKNFTAETGIEPPHHSYTFPEVSDAMKDSTVQPSTAAMNWYRPFAPTIPSISGMIFNNPSSTVNVASNALKTQVAWEKQIHQYNQDHGTTYQTFDQMVPQTQQSVRTAQATAQQSEIRSPGILGAASRIYGQVGAGISLDNAPNLAMMAGMALGNEAAPAQGVLPILGRYATAGLANVAMAAVNQFGFTQSQRAGVGVPLSTKEIIQGLPAQFVTGAAFHGLNEIAGSVGKYFFPGKTPNVAADISSNLKDAAAEDTHTGALAKQLIDTKTPDEAAHVANTARTSDVADLVNQIHTDPDDGTRAIMQAAEPEINLEQTRQPGMTYEDHAQNLVDTAKNVNEGQTILDNGSPGDIKTASAATNDYIDRYLAGKGISDKEARGDSMLQAIAKAGGLRPDEGGELSAMDADKWIKTTGQKPGTRGLIKSDGMTLDDAANFLHQRGYFPDSLERPDINEFLGAVSNELHGNPRYSEIEDNPHMAAQQEALRQLDQHVQEAGIDPKGMTRQELLKALNDHAQEYFNGQQEEYNKLNQAWDTQLPATDHAAEFENSNAIQALRDQVSKNPGIGDVQLSGNDADAFREKLSLYDPEQTIALGDGESMKLKDVMDQIKEDENLRDAMNNCLVG